MKMSIPDLATEIVLEALPHFNVVNSSTIFLVGSKSVGKSTLLRTFLEKNDTLRETLVLEYSFGRKTVQKQGIDKSICHAWEYGGNLDMLSNVLRSVPIRGKYTYVIMLDLSKVKDIWNTFEVCLQSYQELCNASTTPDLILIGGKYDIFKNHDSEIKKTVCVTLRSMAIIYKCDLFFYSSKEPILLRRAKDIFHGIGFGTGLPSKDKIFNHNKPLFIPKELDSWENIGIGKSTLEQVKARHLSLIPSPPRTSRTSYGYSNDLLSSVSTSASAAYVEPVIDSLVTAKYDELRSITAISG